MIPIIHKLHSNGNPNAMEFHTCFPISREQKYALREKFAEIDGLVFADVIQSEFNTEIIAIKEEDSNWDGIVSKVINLLQEIQPENIPDIEVRAGKHPDKKKFLTNFPIAKISFYKYKDIFEHVVSSRYQECKKIDRGEKTAKALLKIKGLRSFHLRKYNLYIEIEEENGITWEEIEPKIIKAINKSRKKHLLSWFF